MLGLLPGGALKEGFGVLHAVKALLLHVGNDLLIVAQYRAEEFTVLHQQLLCLGNRQRLFVLRINNAADAVSGFFDQEFLQFKPGCTPGRREGRLHEFLGRFQGSRGCHALHVQGAPPPAARPGLSGALLPG